VLNADQLRKLMASSGAVASDELLREPQTEELVLQRIAAQISEFPGHAHVRRCCITLDAWTIENGLLTPTMKVKRAKVMEKYSAEIERMYAGH